MTESLIEDNLKEITNEEMLKCQLQCTSLFEFTSRDLVEKRIAFIDLCMSVVSCRFCTCICLGLMKQEDWI